MVQRQVSIRPPTRVFKRPIIHPSECRSFAYPEVTRTLTIDTLMYGEDGIENQTIARQRENGLYPSASSVNRWMWRL